MWMKATLVAQGNLKSNSLNPDHFFGISFCFIVRISRCPSMSLPTVPPKVICFAKIGLDIFTSIVLPLTDELTDITSGVRYFK